MDKLPCSFVRILVLLGLAGLTACEQTAPGPGQARPAVPETRMPATTPETTTTPPSATAGWPLAGWQQRSPVPTAGTEVPAAVVN